MNKRWPIFSRRSAKRGITLIEVLAGLMILGSLLASILIAKGNHMRQWTQANRRIQAVEAAESLLAQWWPQKEMIPRSGAGRLEGDKLMTWRTQLIDNSDLAIVGVQVLRLSIHDHREGHREQLLAQVDVFLPQPPPPRTPETPASGIPDPLKTPNTHETSSIDNP